MITLIVLMWLICSLLSYGAVFAHLQRQFPMFAKKDYEEDRNFALVMSIFGPIGLLTALMVTRGFKHGFKFR